MKSKYKEKAKEILINLYTEYADSFEHNFGTPTGKENFIKTMTNEINGRQILIETMCELVEEIEGDYLKGLEALKTINKFLLDETDSMYTKEQVEELLQKQRELCSKKVVLMDNYRVNHKLIVTKEKFGNNRDYYINKESILNAKLKID